MAEAVEVRAEKGPVAVTYGLASNEISVGEAVELRIDAVAEPGVDVRMPTLEETVGDFEVIAAQRPPDIPDGDKRRWTHRYRLNTFESGDLELPAVTVAFTDQRDPSSPIEGEIETEPLTLTVVSIVGEEPDVSALEQVLGLVAVPVEGVPPSWWIAGIVVGVIALLVVVWWLVRRRRGDVEAPVVVIPAHEWAYAELDRLQRDDLVGAGDLHEYFFRLSSIVREYIERRFGLSAPDRTTEEFIREMRQHPVLDADHQELLKQFLRAADMVKFALHEPPRAEAESALVTARAFVEQTALRRPDPAEVAA